MKISEATIEQLNQYVSYTNALFEMDQPVIELTPLLAESLYKRVVDFGVEFTDALLTYKAYPHTRGCTGPTRGEPYCVCTMCTLLEQYKFHIAVMIKERMDKLSY